MNTNEHKPDLCDRDRAKMNPDELLAEKDRARKNLEQFAKCHGISPQNPQWEFLLSDRLRVPYNQISHIYWGLSPFPKEWEEWLVGRSYTLKQYCATVHPDHSGWNHCLVKFPDFPGRYYTAAEGLDQALMVAYEVVSNHIGTMQWVGERVPEPGPICTTSVDEDVIAVFVINVYTPIEDTQQCPTTA